MGDLGKLDLVHGDKLRLVLHVGKLRLVLLVCYFVFYIPHTSEIVWFCSFSV